MPTFDEITDYCLKKAGAWADFPFGPDTLLIKVGKHYFCSLSAVKGKRIMTVKCTPEEGVFWRSRYPGKVTRGYHCPPVQQPYNNTVYLDAGVPDAELYRMIDFSYDYNLKKMTKRERAELRQSLSEQEKSR